MKEILKHAGCCAPLALHYLAGGRQRDTLKVCYDCGFDNGMTSREWRDAAKELGLEIRKVPLKPKSHRLGRAAKKYKTGVYLVETPGHLLIIENGKIIDLGNREKKPYRFVEAMYRVLNR